jgi:hypothetical protein
MNEYGPMSDQVSPEHAESVQRGPLRYYLYAGIALAILILLYSIFAGSGGSVAPPRDNTVREDPVQTARMNLNKATDLITCRDALSQINQRFNKQPMGAEARLSAADADFLKQRLELKDDEWREISSDTFTLLDAHHLETAFLLRDAAASFTRDGALTNLPLLQRAVLAFDWSVRQVRLQEDRETDPLPVGFVLRRGYGTALERALVFLALLQQFEVPGCLIARQEALGNAFPLWCCGVLVEGDIYLFDPRMGLPLPGSKGNGIATLAGARTDPTVLQQLALDDSHQYDVTAEQAQKARLYIAVPLSALAPRMRALEKTLQDPDVAAPIIHGRLAADAVQLTQQFDAALAKTDNKDRVPVQTWPAASRALRSFLPAEEGGIDRGQRANLFRLQLIPLRDFPPQITRNMGYIHEMLLQKFGAPFLSLWFDPQQPRDLIIRGHFREASRSLTGTRQEALKQAARLKATVDLNENLKKVLTRLIEAQAQFQIAQRSAGQAAANNPAVQQAQAARDAAFKDAQPWLDILIEGHAARPLGEEVNYQLALAKHEEAERLQLRADEAVRLKKPRDVDPVDPQAAWQNAKDWWATYIQEYADAPTIPCARSHAARTRLMIGERDAALDLLRDLSDTTGKLTDLEKLGRLYLVRELDRKK